MNQPEMFSRVSDVVFATALAYCAAQADHGLRMHVVRPTANAAPASNASCEPRPDASTYLERLGEALEASDGMGYGTACRDGE